MWCSVFRGRKAFRADESVRGISACGDRDGGTEFFVRERLPLSALRSFESGPRGDGCDGKLCARAWYPRAESVWGNLDEGLPRIKPDEVPQRNLLREKFYAEVQPFAERMKKKDATVRERTEALYALAVQNQMQEKLEERRQQFEQQGQEAFAKEYSQIYGIVMELLDKIVEVLGEEKMTLAEYQEILEAGFAEASVGIIPPTADQVLIGDNERSRLKDIRVLFFVGVNDGLIPRHDAGGGILSEYDREELERRMRSCPRRRGRRCISRNSISTEI